MILMTTIPDKSVSNDSAPHEGIEAKLARAWRRERRFCHTRGAAHLIFWVVGLFLFDLVVDWSLGLSGLARLVLLAANLALLAGAGYWYWLRSLRRFDPTRVALQVERLHGGLKNLLVSYVQLNGSARGAVHGSPRLIEALRGQAVTSVGPLDFGGIVNFRLLRPLLIGAAAVLLLFAASSLVAGGYYRVLFVHLFNPFSRLGYPTRTRIVEVTGDLPIKEGDRLNLQARVSGEVPDQGFLHVKHGDASWEKIALERGAEPVFDYPVSKATHSFAYYFQIGDARSESYQVTVVPPPHVIAAQVALRFPPYTGRAPEEHASLHLPAVPEGTEIRWEMRVDQPLAGGQLRILRDDAVPLDFTIDADDPRLARLTVADAASLLPPPIDSGRRADSVSYRFRWTERAHGFTFQDHTHHSLDVIPDQPPVVTLLSPRLRPDQERVLVTKRKVLNLTFDAVDDYGLARAWIAYRVNDEQKTRRRPVGDFPPGTKNDTFQTSWTIRESLPEIREGDVLTCEVEASDNRESKAGLHLGRSRPLVLKVVSEEEYQRYVEKEKLSGLERTKTAVRDEMESAKKVKLLIPE